MVIILSSCKVCGRNYVHPDDMEFFAEWHDCYCHIP